MWLSSGCVRWLPAFLGKECNNGEKGKCKWMNETVRVTGNEAMEKESINHLRGNHQLICNNSCWRRCSPTGCLQSFPLEQQPEKESKNGKEKRDRVTDVGHIFWVWLDQWKRCNFKWEKFLCLEVGSFAWSEWAGSFVWLNTLNNITCIQCMLWGCGIHKFSGLSKGYLEIKHGTNRVTLSNNYIIRHA